MIRLIDISLGDTIFVFGFSILFAYTSPTISNPSLRAFGYVASIKGGLLGGAGVEGRVFVIVSTTARSFLWPPILKV